MSIDGVIFSKKKFAKIYQGRYPLSFWGKVAHRTNGGTNNRSLKRKPVNFLNSFGATGFYFQTGAWERNNSKNVGIFWLALRYIGYYTNPSQLKEFLPAIKTNGKYYGYSIGWGVEINSLVNIKVLYYKYIKKPEIDYLLPIYQFSFNYSMK